MANKALSNQLSREVEVDRKKLIEILVRNKDNHIMDYRQAVNGYVETAMEKLRTANEKAKQDIEDYFNVAMNKIKRFNPDDPGNDSYFTLVKGVTVDLPIPRCYADEYDTAIQIANWDVNDTMVLTGAEFRCFVEDKWDWKDDFEATISNYRPQ